MALTAMEEPVSFSAADLTAEKTKVLSAVRLPKDLAAHTARGQYAAGWQGSHEVVGYLDEKGINPASTTETYAAIRLMSIHAVGPACRSTYAPANVLANASRKSQ